MSPISQPAIEWHRMEQIYAEHTYGKICQKYQRETKKPNAGGIFNWSYLDFAKSRPVEVIL